MPTPTSQKGTGLQNFKHIVRNIHRGAKMYNLNFIKLII